MVHIFEIYLSYIPFKIKINSESFVVVTISYMLV